jgi:hypothetical protein
MNKLKLIVLSFLVLLSCKKEQSNKAKDVIETTKSDLYQVILNVRVLNDDSFQIFYKYENEAPFLEENSKWVELKGSEEPQDIIFTLPDNELPNFFRIDFGVNKKQAPIDFFALTFDYQGKKVTIDQNQLLNVMISNECIEISNVGLQVVLTPKDKNGIYDPLLYSEFSLQKLLELIY